MLTVREVAEHLGCSKQTVRNMIKTGRLPASRRLGTPKGAYQVTERALSEFLEATGENVPRIEDAAKSPGAAA